MKRISIFISIAFVVLVSGGWAQAQKPAYDFITIDPPGSVETFVKGINTQGDIVGRFIDAAGNRHGFLLSDGIFHVIAFCESTIGSANGINARGEIVGGCDGAYLLSRGRVIRISFPGEDTAPWGINDKGDIVGNYYPEDGSLHGFLLSRGVYTKIDLPGACSTNPGSINDAGDIVGDYSIDYFGEGNCAAERMEYRGFLLKDGTFTAIEHPNGLPGPGQYPTVPRGINAQGDVVGTCDSVDGGTHGFLMQKGVFTDIDFPDAVFTRPSAINARGWIVGDYRDTSGVRHGFLATR